MAKLDVDNNTDLARRLIRDIGLASVPGSSFYSEPGQGRNQI